MRPKTLREFLDKYGSVRFRQNNWPRTDYAQVELCGKQLAIVSIFHDKGLSGPYEVAFRLDEYYPGLQYLRYRG